jgi:hypothetical protein
MKPASEHAAKFAGQLQQTASRGSAQHSPKLSSIASTSRWRDTSGSGRQARPDTGSVGLVHARQGPIFRVVLTRHADVKTGPFLGLVLLHQFLEGIFCHHGQRPRAIVVIGFIQRFQIARNVVHLSRGKLKRRYQGAVYLGNRDEADFRILAEPIGHDTTSPNPEGCGCKGRAPARRFTSSARPSSGCSG